MGNTQSVGKKLTIIGPMGCRLEPRYEAGCHIVLAAFFFAKHDKFLNNCAR
jgi:hypothetical protein